MPPHTLECGKQTGVRIGWPKSARLSRRCGKVLASQLKTSLWVRKCSRPFFKVGAERDACLLWLQGMLRAAPADRYWGSEASPAVYVWLCVCTLEMPVGGRKANKNKINQEALHERRNWQQRKINLQSAEFWTEPHLAEVILITDRLSSLIFTIDIDGKLHMVLEIWIY